MGEVTEDSRFIFHIPIPNPENDDKLIATIWNLGIKHFYNTKDFAIKLFFLIIKKVVSLCGNNGEQCFVFKR